jgi:imidazolonepropionase
MTARARKKRSTPERRLAGVASLLIVHAAELVTLRGAPGPRTHEASGELGLIEDGAVYAKGGRIVDLGRTSEVVARHPRAEVRIDASGNVVLPGFIDAHTHAVFAGSREHEVEWKALGLSYSQIAARGGGILRTVRATREASEEELARTTADRFRTMLASGTTTMEAKSGYGLRTADEIKMLRAAATAGRLAGVDVVPTFLGAHAVPPEFEGRTESYVDLVAGEMLDAVAANRLAAFCDIFVDEGYFSTDHGLKLLSRARSLGLLPKVHADELAQTGGAKLAAEVRAASADHLIHPSSDGIDAMARSGVIGVLLPAASLASHLPFADGRRLIAAGVPVALGTDFNPNCWCESLQLPIALACHHNGLLPAQAIVAATVNAAHAIGRGSDLGTLEPGKLADILLLDIPSYRHLGYRIGGNVVRAVVKRGRLRVGPTAVR